MSERSAETVLLQLHSLSDPDSETEVHVKSKSRLRGAVSGRNGESIPLMSSCTSGGATASDEDEGRNVFSDREFTVLVRSAMEAIRHGVLPQRISQGSSGSYFVKNIDEVRGAHVGYPRCVLWWRYFDCNLILGKYWRVQTKGRGAIWPPEPQVDQVGTQAVLSLLLW